ncbi:RTA1-domain-containing protein [Pleurostoma richardsiae]|uniref:RTA1-domain-containing protein n=1 Tax=Pleurostoma richardsiae TaxID=41990 RepID=A0AA38RJG4_9PEZI|nr:RTA1-domain-containing protein [Pleurostoma richardsiae]
MDNSTSGGNTASQASDGDGFEFKLYRYNPSLAAAIVFVAVFSALTALHVWRMSRSRALYFMAFTIGGLFEVVGYCGRIWSHFDDTAIGGFVMQAILILVAPALYAASIYMVLGRLIRALHAEHLSLIPVRWLTKVFVIGDLFSFTLQAGGGGIQGAGTLDMFNIGEKVIIVGLFMQIAFFGFFIVSAILFDSRITRQPTRPAAERTIPWRRHLIVLYAVSIIILIRSIFRVIEYLQGNAGYIISHEYFLYIFDAVLMALVMAILLIYYVDDLDRAVARRNKSSSSGSDYLMNDVTA